MNAEWHRAHKLERDASLEERIAWHTEHAEVCGCREMPEHIRAEIARRAGAGSSGP